MNGLELSEQFFHQEGLQALLDFSRHFQDGFAAGLVGEGSECFGWDDAYSRDHDWGAGFQIWLSPEDAAKYGEALQKWYESLADTFLSFPVKKITVHGERRVGVWNTEHFYYRFIANSGIPQTPVEWLYAPESSFACVTNGKIFYDCNSSFTKIRSALLKGYPEDVRFKKLAACVIRMAQAGQYNYGRCRKRHDDAAAFLAVSEFVKETICAVHLLNHTYTPFYKWMFQSLSCQKILSEIQPLLLAVSRSPLHPETSGKIEQLCEAVRMELTHQNLTDADSDFLEPHGRSIAGRILDPELRKLPLLSPR